MACLNSISMLRENLLEATKVTISIVNYLKNFMVLSNASCFNSTMLKFNEMKVMLQSKNCNGFILCFRNVYFEKDLLWGKK